jgi:hypothetical protein
VPEAAEAWANRKGALSLDGLDTLPPEIAEALAKRALSIDSLLCIGTILLESAAANGILESIQGTPKLFR